MSKPATPQPVQVFCITVRSNGGRLREIRTPVHTCVAFDPATHVGVHPTFAEFAAVWDTGATNCAITQRVVDACGLKPITMRRVQYGGGEELAEVYKINIRLPNGIAIPNVHVTKGKFSSPDVLIGMDLITLGDFSITNEGGTTVFSFRVPSIHTVDFNAHPGARINNGAATAQRHPPRPGNANPASRSHRKRR